MFRIRIAEPAERDIESVFHWWRDNRSAEQATRWYSEIHVSIDTLRSMPLRCPLCAETDLHPAGIRQLLFGLGRRPTHRIVFTVLEDGVTILRVRHVAQRSLRENDPP